MIRPFLLASAAALCLTATATAETRSYDAAGFTGLDVSAGIDVIFETGNSFSVTAENEKGDFSDLKIETKGDALVITRAKKNWNGWKKRERYTVTVTAPVISEIDASSGADVSGSGLTGETTSLSASSGADIDVTDIQVTNISLDTSSGADITASGTCNSVTAESSSGSDIEAGDLICLTGNADASSGSDIEIHVTQSVIADASSGADIDVSGGPKDADIDKSSGGSVRIRS